MWQSWISLVAGIWAIISGLVYSLVTPVNFLITGLVIAIFGFWAPSSAVRWQGSINGIVGLFLVLCAFIMSLQMPVSFLIAGVAVLVLASWQVVVTSPRGKVAQQPRT